MVLEDRKSKVKGSHLVGTVFSPQSCRQHKASDGKRERQQRLSRLGKTYPELVSWF